MPRTAKAVAWRQTRRQQVAIYNPATSVRTLLHTVPRLVHSLGRRLPRGWGDLLRQFAFFFVAYQGYQLVRGIADGRDAVAFANGVHVMQLERSLGAFFEPGFQQAFLSHQWVIEIANWMYFNSHFVITISFLAWLYLFRNENFNFVRNMFMVAMGLALIGYALFPTAPPRMFPGAGFTDTIEVFTNMNQDSSFNSVLVNPYAAVPSMHIAFSLMIAVPAMSLVRSVWARAPVVRLPAARLLRDHGDREPLLVRRRRGSRRGLPGGGLGASARAPAPARLVLAGRGDGRGARLTAGSPLAP